MIPQFILEGRLTRLRSATERWYAQVLFYLLLALVFFSIDQLFVADLYDYFFRGTEFFLNYLFMGGDWIPAFANVIVIVVANRARTLIGYLLPAMALTYLLAIPYYFITGGEAHYGHDSLGAAGASVMWTIAWFWSLVAGLTIKFLLWRNKHWNMQA